MTAAGAVFITSLFTFLWALLLVIPGIIKALSYSQTLYILAENPDMKIMEAIGQSRKMMDGAKGKLIFIATKLYWMGVTLYFNIWNWPIVLIPYMNVSFAAFYIWTIRNNYEDIDFIKSKY